MKVDLGWLKREPRSPTEFAKLEKANVDNPQAQTFYGIQARNLAKTERGGRAHHARDRRQQALGAARGDGWTWSPPG